MEPIALTGTALWHVTGGSADLFAVEHGGYGRWHLLGRAGTGTVLAPPPPDSTYLLVARPGRHFAVQPLKASDGLAAGIDAGLRLMSAAVTGNGAVTRAPVPVQAGDRLAATRGRYLRAGASVVWLEVASGQLVYRGEPVVPGGTVPVTDPDAVLVGADAVVVGHSTAQLLADGTLAERLVDATARLWRALDRVVVAGHAREAERIVAGRRAGDAALAAAVRALRAGASGAARAVAARAGASGAARAGASGAPRARAARSARVRDATVAVAVRACVSGSDVEEAATAAGFRTRAVRLDGRWWRHNAGPLIGRPAAGGDPVALVWRRGRYRAVDCGTGRRSRVTARSAAAFASAALMLYRPIPDGATGAWRLLRYGLRGTRPDVARMAVGGTVAVALGLLVPVVTGQVLGRYVPAGERGLLVQACLAVAVAALVSMAFAAVANLSLVRIEGRFEATLQSGVWDRLLRLPTGFFRRYPTGDLAGRALSVSAIRETLSGVAAVAVHAVLLGAVNFALQLWLSPPLALLSVALAAVHATVFAAVGVRQLHWQRRLVALENRLTNQVFQTLQGLPKLRVAAAESHAYAHWAVDFGRSQQLHRRVRRLQGAVTVFTAGYLPLCLLILFAVLDGPARHALSLGRFLTFVVAFAVQLASMSQLTAAVTAAAAVLPLFQQFQPILAQPPEVDPGSRAPGELTGGIEVAGVSFRYAADGPPVLDNVSLRVAPGSFVAIVGPTGCGKSTLLRLLIGFERPALGSVRYDGHDLSTLDVAAVRRQIGVVLQDARPFSGTILENICGAERYPIERVREAARMAGLYDDIAAMPMGLQTPLTDGGATLSAGQRQRLLIAQAMLRRPRILFFDEATSALDNETQRIVARSTRALRATRIVIAHRLSTVLSADEVVVLDRGRVVQCGAPADLLADRDGLFSRLARRQSGEAVLAGSPAWPGSSDPAGSPGPAGDRVPDTSYPAGGAALH